MKDPVYTMLLAFSLIFGITLALADASFVVLYAILIALSPLASRGLDYYRSISEYVDIHQDYDYRYALLGLLPLSLMVEFSWTDMLLGSIALIVVAVAEETFRAGSVVLLRDQIGLPGNLAIVTANAAWISYHFIQKPYDPHYLVFLIFGAIIFTIALIFGGIGAAVLAHILSNSLATWIAISVSGTAQTVDITLGGILALIVFLIGVSGFARKRD